MQRRQLFFNAAGAALALQGLGVQPAHAAVVDEQWTDDARQRAMPVRLRWPDGDSPCALIVHSHGLGGNRNGGDAWGEAWRAAGFALLHVQHPGSDTEVLRHGMRMLRAAASAEQLRARIGDMRFAVDEITRRVQQRGGGWSRVRLDALGASGHSFGAVTVQAVAGQRFALETPGSTEPRFKAFVAFSPSLSADVPAADALAAVTRPFLCVTGSLDSDALGRSLTGADRARVYDALPRGQRALLWLDGADHMSFGGNAAQGLRARFGPLKREPVAVERERRHHELVATISTLWWRARLLGDTDAAALLREPKGMSEGDRWRQD